MKGRFIFESVVVAHELVHSIHKSQEPSILLKLDYKKSYERVNWQLLFNMIKYKKKLIIC